MTSSSSFTAAERLNSLKFAILGGFCAGTVSLMVLVLHRLLVLGPSQTMTGLIMSMASLTLLINGAIAAISGALFALTYRYAVRQDENVQLKTGVVTAFTLVRGLAQVDAGSAIAQNFWPFVSACGESFLLFGLTALILAFSIEQEWIEPFGQKRSSFLLKIGICSGLICVEALDFLHN